MCLQSTQNLQTTESPPVTRHTTVEVEATIGTIMNVSMVASTPTVMSRTNRTTVSSAKIMAFAHTTEPSVVTRPRRVTTGSKSIIGSNEKTKTLVTFSQTTPVILTNEAG